MYLAISKVLTDKSLIEETITVKGWIRTIRKQPELSFISIHDGSCNPHIQAVAINTLNNYEEICKLSAGCSVSITGKLVSSPAKGQSVEIKATKIEIVGLVDKPESYPMTPKRHSPEHLRAHAHLRPRTNLAGSTARIRHCVMTGINEFFNKEGFLWVNTPLITSSDCEGAGEMFRVSTLDLQNIPLTDNGNVDYSQDFFGKETHLTVSGQLNAETYACALTKVYTCGPTFRAENSNTSRHLSEFWMVEPEVAFSDMTDSILLAEHMLKYVVNKVLTERSDDMEFFNQFVDETCIKRLTEFVNSKFVTLDYTDAIEILKNSGKSFEINPVWGIDLGSEHERYLAEEHVKAPVALINYPKDIKSFYMKQNPDGKTVAAFDILAPEIGEIIGGSQREEDLSTLIARMEELDMNPDDYEWYLDLRRYGTVPHSGFGLGVERLISYITGVSNVRDTIPFPRTPNNIDF
jgi:asparaginyl-tRNA synthetase